MEEKKSIFSQVSTETQSLLIYSISLASELESWTVKQEVMKI